MKTPLLITLVALLIIATGCEKSSLEMLPSACLISSIETFKKESLCNDASVKEYRFQQKPVYVFDNGNCGADLASIVTDDACNKLGSLGGITGNQIINGESFANAVFVRTVWKK
jgi:hypothetical protein